jgi:four helix bundle protein
MLPAQDLRIRQGIIRMEQVASNEDYDVIQEAVASYGTPVPLARRTKAFALRIIRLYTQLPKRTESQVIGKQVLRSGTSVGANYREATRARSNVEFVTKIEISLMELEETCYWLELLVEAEIVASKLMSPLLTEANELLAILTAIVTKVKQRK